MIEDDNYQFSVRMLGPDDVKLFRTPAGDARVRATLTDDRSFLNVRIARAFPFTRVNSYIGLRDAADAEIGMVVDPSVLDADSRKVIEEELSRRYFTPRVEKVMSVDEQFGTATFRVMTDRGERRIVVRNLRDNAHALGPVRVLMTDSEGNRYDFPDITKYGARAYEVLAKVL